MLLFVILSVVAIVVAIAISIIAVSITDIIRVTMWVSIRIGTYWLQLVLDISSRRAWYK